MPTKLIPVVFVKEDHHLFGGFRCGKEEHEVMLANYLKTQILDDLRHGKRIWRYMVGDRTAGYGVLGKLTWFATDKGTPEKVKIVSLTNLALHEDFWQKPDDAVSAEEKFSRQLVRHLQSEAQAWVNAAPSLYPLLSLLVHPANAKARSLYLKCGFEDYPDFVYEDKKTGAKCPCLIFKLKPRPG